jgi:hypothetical protein
MLKVGAVLGGVVVPPPVPAGVPPPHPAMTASVAASKINAEHLEIFCLEKKFRTEAPLCPIGLMAIMDYYAALGAVQQSPRSVLDFAPCQYV